MQDTVIITPALPVQKIGKWKGSFLIASESFKLLKQDKELILFPVLGGLTNLIFAFVCLGFVFLAVFKGYTPSVIADLVKSSPSAEHIAKAIFYVIIFILYLVGAYIATYFQAGLMAVVHMRLAGQAPTFKDGIHAANSHWWKIFKWSLVAATVGIVLQAISEKGWIGKVISSLLGVAWNIVTLFIVPVLIFEDDSIGNSIKRSGSIFRAVWGETLIVNFTVGLNFFFAMFIGVLVYGATWFSGSYALIAVSSALFFLFVIALSVLSSTLSSIFKVVLYEYATNKIVPGGFPEELIAGALGKK